jgi:hypothetical protein
MPRIPYPEKFWQKVDRRGPDECWPWQGGVDEKGYGHVILYPRTTKAGRKHTRAHRYAWTLTHGEIPDGVLICHRCDNPPCCNPNHLFPGTGSDNMQDMWQKKRHSDLQGEKNGRARLTWEDVLEIRRRYAAGGVTFQSLADERGMNKSAMHRLVRGLTWKSP